MAYQRPNPSRLAVASTRAAARRSGAPLLGGNIIAKPVHRAGLGDYLDDIAAQAYKESANAPSADVPAGAYSYGNAGISSSGGSSGSGIAAGIVSAIGGLFGNKPATMAYVPPTSNTSTYLLIGGVVLGGILLVTLLK